MSPVQFLSKILRKADILLCADGTDAGSPVHRSLHTAHEPGGRERKDRR